MSMMIISLFVVMVSLATFGVIYFSDKLTTDKRFFVFIFSVLVSSLTLIMPTAMVGDSQGKDKMILNGYVTGKERVWTSCSHSYSCNCRIVTSGKTTTTQCSTCYEHTHDYDWKVKSTVGSAYINRIDRQGVREPERFTLVKVGEPFSIERSYFNYIKASPHSVFKDFNAYKNVSIPSYPKVYDYYRVKHTVNWKSKYVSGINQIDQLLAQKLKTSSGKVKANVVIIFYSGTDDIIEATKVRNYGGRINDLTVMIRADADGKIQRVGAFSWSKSDMVNVLVRDSILGLGELNEENNKKLVDNLNEILLKYYQHKSNEEFEYLKQNIKYPTALYVWLFFAVFAQICAMIFIKREL